MDIKKILVLLLFAVAIIGIVAPAEAKLAGSVDTSFDGNKVTVNIGSDIGFQNKDFASPKYFPKRKAEVSKINKIIIKVEGYKPITLKNTKKDMKPYYKHNSYSYFKQITLKGPPLRNSDTNAYRKYSIKCYDKKNKLILHKKYNQLPMYVGYKSQHYLG